MFWTYKCDKCQRVWRYPIRECIFCRGQVAATLVKEARLKCESRVMVASPDNLAAPYRVQLLTDKDGNYFLKKKKEEKEPGRKAGVEVAVVKTDYSPAAAAKMAMALLKWPTKPIDKVLVKPNLAVAREGSSGIVTNPLVVEGVVEFLLEEKGIKPENLIVGECSVLGFNTGEAALKSGLLDVCQKHGVKFVDLATRGYLAKDISYQNRKFRFEISELETEADLIVNVPVVKTHFQTGWSLALKNMKGLVSYGTRKLMHKEDLDNQIVLLNTVIKKYLTVLDGSVALEGMGPANLGSAVDLGLIIAGFDPVAVEKIVSKITGLKMARHTRMAYEHGLGEIREKRINILGEEIGHVKRKFKAATDRLSPHPDIELLDGKPCSGCLNSLWMVLNQLKTIRGKKVSLAFGGELDINDNYNEEIGAVGNCAIEKLLNYPHLKTKIMGCPPPLDKLTEYVKELLESK